MNKIKGFTLIELIIGITILSLLAVALLAALDPVEQFNKARDTATRNTVMEIHNALLRYNAAKETYPDPLSTPNSDLNITGSAGFVNLLVTPGELKANFVNSAGGDSTLNKIGIYRVGNTGTIMTCYRPQSKQFHQANSMGFVNGAPGVVMPTIPDATSCPGGASNDPNCVWCAQ
ncbi:MAG: prepilin-type N-terminal cleavage/methylation domain-containing protein [Patescibacteria group bacterium]